MCPVPGACPPRPAFLIAGRAPPCYHVRSDTPTGPRLWGEHAPMSWNTPRARSAAALLALVGLAALAGNLTAQEKKGKGLKRSATIKVMVPDPSYKTTDLKVYVGEDKKGTLVKQEGEERTIVTKPIVLGKKLQYK